MTASPSVRRFALVGIALPVAATVGALVAELALLPTLPDPVAIHWDAAGRANGFGGAWTVLLLTLVFGGVVPILLAASALPGLRRGDRGTTYRVLGAGAAGLSVLFAVLMPWSLALQSGLADAEDAPGVLPALVASYACAAAAGTIAWFAQPRGAWTRPAGAPVTPLALGAGERAVWVRTTSMSRAGAALLAAACAILIAATIGTALLGDSHGAAWIVGGITLLVLVLTATTVAFRVRVDHSGLHVDSVLGLPRMRVRLEDVVSAVVVDVNPLGEFGGWGIRLVPGRFGVVLRAGEALEVARRSGRSFVVTVDDATTAAALLEALARRSGPRGADRAQRR